MAEPKPDARTYIQQHAEAATYDSTPDKAALREMAADVATVARTMIQRLQTRAWEQVHARENDSGYRPLPPDVALAEARRAVRERPQEHQREREGWER